MNDIPCTYRVSVKAIITNKSGGVLLLQETDGQWDLPGGGLEHGEQARNAIRREVAEETGYTVTSVSEMPVTFWTVTRPGSPVIAWFAFVAYAVTVSGEFNPAVSTNDTANACRYVTKEVALTMNLHPNARKYFEALK